MSKTVIHVKLTHDTSTSIGELPTQLVIANPLETLCVDLIGQCTLKGKDGIEINFMCLTMIDPASSWFDIVELPVTTDAVVPMDTKGQRVSRHIITNE